ncbi:MAG: hypothetical protein ABIR03_08845 [Ginsengibacter sp.]
MKSRLKYCILTVMFLVSAFISYSQQSPAITKITKFKPPVVKTFLGANQNGAGITAEQASQLLSFPLKIVDDKNNEYAIDSYQFLYRRKGVTEDEQTGKTEVSFTIVSNRFFSTPLPKVWIETIKDSLKKEEQLYFFDIVVTDKQGRRFSAPELKITIQ